MHNEAQLRAAFDLTPKTGGHRLDTSGSIITYALELMKSVMPRDRGGTPALHDHLANGCAVHEYCLQGPYSWWFRGVASDYALNSGVFRSSLEELRTTHKIDDYADLDRRLQHEYFYTTHRRIEEMGNSIWDRLFEMQHHGMPTRLLDWTFNLLTAILFAVTDRIESEKSKDVAGDAVVWMLNPRLLSKAAVGEAALNDPSYLEMHGCDSELRRWEREDLPLAFGTPNWIYRWLVNKDIHFPIPARSTNQRVLAQCGCFTLQGGSKERNSLDSYAAERANDKHKPCARFLLKLRINPEKCNDIRQELNMIGVDRRLLFPDLENAARSLREHHNI
jgi:hypothetical protein